MDHKECLAWLDANSNRDGFFYPGQASIYDLDPVTHTGKKIERSERPAAVFHMPASHEISVSNPVGSDFAEHSLIIHLLAFIYGTRLQLSEWRFDGRIPTKTTHNIHISNGTCLHFLDHVYSWWQGLGKDEKTKVINVLYVLTRARSLEWPWEAFIHQYMVFDSLYKLYEQLNSLKQKVNHKMRFEILINEYGIKSNDDLIKQIYEERNKLFHEAIWANTSICNSSQEANALYPLPYHLDRLNSRIFCKMTGYCNEYASSKWWTMGTFQFLKA